MPGFQPDPTTDGLYYPSGQFSYGAATYATTGLTEAPSGSDLYAFDVGDYAYPSLNPIPHIELTIFALTAGTATVTVWRTAAGRTQPVRGQIRAYAVGGVNVIDWEAPFGIPVTYRAEQFDTDGNSLGFTPAFSTQLDVAETWWQNVFNPKGAVPVRMAGGAASTVTHTTPTDVYYPSGSGLPVAISGQRQGVTDVDVSCLTFTEADADKVRAMFGDPYTTPSVPPILCIRTGAHQNMRLPRPFYVLISTVGEQPLDTASGGSLTRWDCTATEVAPPAPSLVPALLTLDDIDASYPTLAALDAAYSTLFDIDRAYDLAGTAPEETP